MFAANFIPGMDRDQNLTFMMPEDVRNPFFRFYLERPADGRGGNSPCSKAVDDRFGIAMSVMPTGGNRWLVQCWLTDYEKHPCDLYRDDTVFTGEVDAETPLHAQFEAMSRIPEFKTGDVVRRNPWMKEFMAGAAAFLSEDPMPTCMDKNRISAWDRLVETVRNAVDEE